MGEPVFFCSHTLTITPPMFIGFGGTTFHIVLEESESEHHQAYRLNRVPSPILLFAQTLAQLLAQCETLLLQLQSDAGKRRYIELIDACQSLEAPIDSARVVFVTESLAEAKEALQSVVDLPKHTIS